ncbi:sugar phosphate nucleotidyltransferase, partial [Campylobacter coli]
MLQTCIFPAAGYGTRFLPATKTLPKEMLPILTKPLIHYGVDEALEAGMENMGFVTGRGKRALEDYFDISYELEHQISGTKKEYLLDEIRSLINRCTFTFTRQNQMKGLGDAVLKGRPLVGDEAFGVILADDLCVNEEGLNVMAQMVKIYEKYRCTIIAVMEVPKEQVSNYGVISGNFVEENLIMVNS